MTSSAAHEIEGRVVAISRDRLAATLDLEAIPGVMPAMKMEYRFSDPAILERLAAGDRVRGRLEKIGDEYVVVALRRR